MALQILPILLLGGGAAYVYKKQKDKERKKSGAGCPPENTVTIGEMATVAAQVEAKFADKKEPFSAASYGVKTLLPEGCNRNSKNSRVKIQMSADGETVALDISVPDFYMLVLSEIIAKRFEAGKISEEEARDYQAKALDWYKKTTGKNFDPASLGLEKFAKALGEAMLEAMKEAIGGGKGKKGLRPGECPAEVVVNMVGQREAIVQFVRERLSQGDRNPFVLAEKVFNQIVPAPCTKRDFKTMVEVRYEDETRNLNLAAFYAAIVLDILEEQRDRNMLSQMEAANVLSLLSSNYKKLTGEELPENLN